MHYKQNNKEKKSYVQGLRSFSSIIPRGLKGILKKNGYNYSEIIGKWNIFVGKEISSCSYPKSIKMNTGNNNGTLILAVKRGDEITVEYSKNEIINKINSYFGYKLIKTIKIESFNSKIKTIKKTNLSGAVSKNLKKNINTIKSNNIKNSLYKLIESMSSYEK
tara:strand:+ start:20 stop:508 length:489 start_codon:yes stop_codon:yes gene_type:complete